MSLSVGIVGLPNSGKSTLFNTLLKRQMAQVAPYPFTTIEPNVGIVEVPDDRLLALSQIANFEKIVPATITFIDIAGLVKDANKGEGLGNQFLAYIRECDAIIQIIRGFADESVPHYYGSVDPQRDKEIVDLELELAEIKKPTLYVLNQDQVTPLPGFLSLNAQSGEGVDQLINKAYQLLTLITFYTVKGGKELTAWPLRTGSTALEAAGKVHTDMAKGFIKAEVINWQELVRIGNWSKAKEKGKIRLEGRDYPIEDGDVVEFKFHS